jgi:hypothetical protein
MPKGLIGVPPSTSKLLQYADLISSLADSRALEARARFHHSAHIETSLILQLLQYVREQTGKTHWAEMAILLKGACGEHGMNERRLQALWSRGQNRGPWTRAAFRQVAPFPSVTP